MKTTGNIHMDALLKGHTFADLLCSAYGLPAYICLGHVGPDNTSIASLGNWAGEKPEKVSRAPFVAQGKMGELLWRNQEAGLSVTPVEGLEIGFGWMGGARCDSDIVTVSGWRQEHDRLLALVVLYSLQYETRLHHVGWRFASEEAMRVRSAGLGIEAIEVPAEDHMRMYHRVEDGRSPYETYYVEYQYFPNDPHTHVFHWDLVTQDPERLLDFVARAYGAKPKLWEAGENDPVGLVWVTAEKDGTVMGVMARPLFWEID